MLSNKSLAKLCYGVVRHLNNYPRWGEITDSQREYYCDDVHRATMRRPITESNIEPEHAVIVQAVVDAYFEVTQ